MWPSRILEISVAGRRVQVKTEGVLVGQHEVRKPERAEFGRGWPALKCTGRCTGEGGAGKGRLAWHLTRFSLAPARPI